MILPYLVLLSFCFRLFLMFLIHVFQWSISLLISIPVCIPRQSEYSRMVSRKKSLLKELVTLLLCGFLMMFWKHNLRYSILLYSCLLFLSPLFHFDRIWRSESVYWTLSDWVVEAARLACITLVAGDNIVILWSLYSTLSILMYFATLSSKHSSLETFLGLVMIIFVHITRYNVVVVPVLSLVILAVYSFSV